MTDRSTISATARRTARRLAAFACVALLAVGAGGALAQSPSSGAMPATAGPVDSTPVATSVKLESLGNLTRLTFQLTGQALATSYVLADPDRLIVDLPEVDFRIDPSAGRRKSASVRRARGREAKAQPLEGLVNSFRFGLFAPGKSRIVIDLAGPARVVRAASEMAANGAGARLLIDLAATDRASFRTAARQRPAPAPVVATAAPVAVTSQLPLIVIDPGHGGIDMGAHASNGALEKDIVFEFSRILQTGLEGQGRYRVMMTRSSDVFVPLDDRVSVARAAGAALFISIHADTLSDEPGVSGATVYTVSEKASDAQAARVAEKENQADSVAGIEAGDDVGGINDILFDLARRETRAYSNVFARSLVGYFKEVSRLNKNPHRAAGFRVLKAPDVPSVLLELGYLSSDRDLVNLTSAEWRQKVAASVVRAVDRFFQAQTGQPARVTDAPVELKRGAGAEDAEHVAIKQR